MLLRSFKYRHLETCFWVEGGSVQAPMLPGSVRRNTGIWVGAQIALYVIILFGLSHMLS